MDCSGILKREKVAPTLNKTQLAQFRQYAL